MGKGSQRRQETKKDRDNYRKGWERIWGKKKKGKKNAQL